MIFLYELEPEEGFKGLDECGIFMVKKVEN